jgi:D-alanyl-D-alanine carboxypeptidase/D-alanyl-D-alanine-endopeptidase (penicillin-binding protein 4)
VAAARLSGIVDRGLADPRLAGTTVGLSVFVEGLGEVAVHQPDLPLNPASNQKLYTAMAAYATLDPGFAFTTEVRATGAVEGGIVHGDLVLVGGGDPTLRARGPHSLAALAAALDRAGIERVTGELRGDESRYDIQRRAPGWFSWHVPDLVGPLSALTVERNQHRHDAAFTADPVPANLALFRSALTRRGITVACGDVSGPAPPNSTTLASLRSAPLSAIVAAMLTGSDNTAAELLVKEIGYQRRGRGTTALGTEAADDALRVLGVPLRGQSYDGSGLSRADMRSAREWRRLLQAARAQPWGHRLLASMPLAGRTGTLGSRFRGTAAEANLRAKTGWILEGRALSGYLTTAGGRQVVFSMVVNGTNPRAPVVAAIDDLVAELAAEAS